MEVPTVRNYAKMNTTTTTTTTATAASSALDVNIEAKRILAVSISKLYASRSQRGGLRLHRSLLLSLVMRSARDIYHSACLLAQEEEEEESARQAAAEESMDTTGSTMVAPPPSPINAPEETHCAATEESCEHDDDDAEMSGDEETDKEDKENMSPVISPRKRRGKASEAPDFLPSKRARLEPGEERHAVPLSLGGGGSSGATLALGGSSGAIGLGHCRGGESLATLSLNRIIPAF